MFFNLFSTILNSATIIFFIFIAIRMNNGKITNVKVIYSLNIISAYLIMYPVLLNNDIKPFVEISDYVIFIIITLIFVFFGGLMFYFIFGLFMAILIDKTESFFVKLHNEYSVPFKQWCIGEHLEECSDSYIQREREFKGYLEVMKLDYNTASIRALTFVLSIMYFISIMIVAINIRKEF